MKPTHTLHNALLLTSLAGLVLPTCLLAQEKAHPPAWVEKGAYAFRVSTPDTDDVLPRLEKGHAIVANLLDQSIPQITIVNGLIGHDHPGPWNWDGLWPDWNRATFRAGSFDKPSPITCTAKGQISAPRVIATSLATTPLDGHAPVMCGCMAAVSPPKTTARSPADRPRDLRRTMSMETPEDQTRIQIDQEPRTKHQEHETHFSHRPAACAAGRARS